MRIPFSIFGFGRPAPGALAILVAGASVVSCARPPEGATGSVPASTAASGESPESPTPGAGTDASTGMPKPAFDCEIQVAGAPPAGGPVPLTFRLRLRAGPAVHVLSWRTPLEGLRGNDFHVEREGTEIPYRGPMMKRGNPSAKSYLLLEPGKALEAEVDLALAYDFTKAGRYRITFTSSLMDVVTDASQLPRTLDQLEATALSCAPIDVTVGPKR